MSPIITTPGPCEGEPSWVSHFWEAFLNGDGEDDGDTIWFDVTADERAEWPELAQERVVGVWTDEQGFVYGQVGP